MESIAINNWHGQDWTLTTSHPSSSYGIPVLLDSDQTPFGYNDRAGDPGMRAGTLVQNWAVWAGDMLSEEQQAFVAKFTEAQD